jgi:hypothetical protein
MWSTTESDSVSAPRIFVPTKKTPAPLAINLLIDKLQNFLQLF